MQATPSDALMAGVERPALRESQSRLRSGAALGKFGQQTLPEISVAKGCQGQRPAISRHSGTHEILSSSGRFLPLSGHSSRW